MFITLFDIAESEFEISFGEFLQQIPQNGRWKGRFFAFFDFWLFIPRFEAFTIQKRQIKLEIHNSRPKISLETKFQPIIFKTVDVIFFSRIDHFFSIFKNLICQKWTVIFKNRNFFLQIRIPWVDPVLGAKFHESRSKTAIIREEMAIFFESPCNIYLSSYPLHCWI